MFFTKFIVTKVRKITKTGHIYIVSTTNVGRNDYTSPFQKNNSHDFIRGTRTTWKKCKCLFNQFFEKHFVEADFTENLGLTYQKTLKELIDVSAPSYS